jgi:hypothetical protein
MALDHDHCFLCSALLTDDNRTVEHVFPRWLQRDYDLWDQPLGLLNRTDISYRQLTIPCCEDCNGVWLKQIEDQVTKAVRSGPDAVAALDQTTLCLWMIKIYYGLRFKELALPLDQRRRDGGRIVEPEYLARHSELHHMLQAARGRIRFARAPGSLRIFKAQVPEAQRQRFDYRDLKGGPFLAMRMGPTVVIASLVDWGAMDREADPYLQAAAELELHPWQFHEVAAHGAYLALRFKRRFAYLTIPNDGGSEATVPMVIGESPAAAATESPYRSFVGRELAAVMAEFTGLPVYDLYEPANDAVWSNLITAEGQPQTIELTQAPIGVMLVPPSFAVRHRDDENFVSHGTL